MYYVGPLVGHFKFRRSTFPVAVALDCAAQCRSARVHDPVNKKKIWRILPGSRARQEPVGRRRRACRVSISHVLGCVQGVVCIIPCTTPWLCARLDESIGVQHPVQTALFIEISNFFGRESSGRGRVGRAVALSRRFCVQTHSCRPNVVTMGEWSPYLSGRHHSFYL